MDVRTVQSLEEASPDAILIYLLFAGESALDDPAIAERGGRMLRSAQDDGHIELELYDSFFLPANGGPGGLLLVGGGERDLCDPYYMRLCYMSASRTLTKSGYSALAVLDRGIGSAEEFAQAAVEGCVGGAYNAGLKKTQKERKRRVDTLTLVSSRDMSEIGKGVDVGLVIAQARELARDLVNTPPNDLTPTEFARKATEAARRDGLACDVLDEAAMRQRGMGSLLGVAQGSDQPPRVIVLRYGNAEAPVRLALVGKGLTFDSGGLSLKTAEGMETMKCDMGGGAAVLAGMLAIARLAPPGISVTGYIGATENMPGGHAMRPGDVLTAMNGETIEVLNTDAEGRLVLADVLSLAVADGATHIADFATLTGAAVVSLGSAATLAVGRPGDWVAQVVRAAESGLERAWQMPLYREYRSAMDSSVADIKNSGKRWGGALNAAAFLSDFVGDVPWAHFDIAGTAWHDDPTRYAPAGGTGEGVGTIVQLALTLASH